MVLGSADSMFWITNGCATAASGREGSPLMEPESGAGCGGVNDPILGVVIPAFCCRLYILGKTPDRSGKRALDINLSAMRRL